MRLRWFWAHKTVEERLSPVCFAYLVGSDHSFFLGEKKSAGRSFRLLLFMISTKKVNAHLLFLLLLIVFAEDAARLGHETGRGWDEESIEEKCRAQSECRR